MDYGIYFRTSVVLAASALTLVSCSSDEVEDVNRGKEIVFSTSVSRATETNLGNLAEFKVYADAKGYTSMFINGDVAKKNGNSSEYVFEKSYYWPNDVESIRFWAYGPTGSNGIQISPNITANAQSFDPYVPVGDLKNGGLEHKDFVVAYTECKRNETSGMVVSLEFNHALSQVVVNAKKGADDTKRVIVKGVWVVNAKASGELAFDSSKEEDLHYMKWTATGSASYGVQFDNPVTLSTLSAPLIGANLSSGNSGLMLIPQQTPKMDFAAQGSNGAYILVLCRIEAIHQGSAHPDGGPIATEGDRHVHQLFPVNDKAFVKEQYGYTCVPVQIDWMPGKKYVYTLEFCGKDSGAGVYPPTPGVGFPEGVDRPDDKKPGDHVLDNPIKFTVSVEEWKDVTNNTPMN